MRPSVRTTPLASARSGDISHRAPHRIGKRRRCGTAASPAAAAADARSGPAGPQRSPRNRRRAASSRRGSALEPMMVELDPEHVEPIESERMDVAVTDACPIAKFDPELVGRVRRANEIVLVESEERVEEIDLRDGRFADADRSDLLGFHQLDREIRHRAEDLRQCRCRHPPGGAAADDDDLADAILDQRASSLCAAAGLAAAARGIERRTRHDLGAGRPFRGLPV